jgi:cytochrome b6-f complex iron-sulfur subunit
MDRRTFLILSGVGALAGTIPAFLASRTTAITNSAATIAQATAYRAVGRADQVANGQTLQTQIGNTRLIVMRNPSSPNALMALNRRCPHEGCQVNWEASQQKFDCPCHGAQFSPSGAVVQGPARTGLQHYAAHIEGNQVMVQI